MVFLREMLLGLTELLGLKPKPIPLLMVKLLVLSNLLMEMISMLFIRAKYQD